MNKNTLAALVLILAAPVGAQEYRQQQARAAEEAYAAMQAAAAETHNPSVYSGIRGRALDATIDAMNSGPVAAGRVMRFLDQNKIDVQFATQSARVGSGIVNGRASVLLSDGLYPAPPIYAALIAAEASKSMYAGMPDCAERDYMRLATVARVYVELGGAINPSEAEQGRQDNVIYASIKVWAAGPEKGVAALVFVNHVPTLAGAPDSPAAVRFAVFVADEAAARRDALKR
jgi:hypothetical protein